MDNTQFKTLASKESVQNTEKALTENHFIPHSVETKEEALAKVKEFIPEGASVMNGASATLQTIGYIDFLKSGDHKWVNLHEAILAEKDPEKQAALRQQSVLSDFYIGSAHAITETGEIVVASNSGSQLPHLVYTSPNIVLVVGSQKIVPNLQDAFRRIDEYVVGLEDKRMTEAYGYGTTHTKTVILHKENPKMGRKVHIIIVNQELGF